MLLKLRCIHWDSIGRRILIYHRDPRIAFYRIFLHAFEEMYEKLWFHVKLLLHRDVFTSFFKFWLAQLKLVMDSAIPEWFLSDIKHVTCIHNIPKWHVRRMIETLCILISWCLRQAIHCWSGLDYSYDLWSTIWFCRIIMIWSRQFLSHCSKNKLFNGCKWYHTTVFNLLWSI